MSETTWKLTLKNAASTPAKRIARDVLAATAAFRTLGEASITAQAHLSRFGSAGTTLQIRSVTTAIRDQTKALRELNSVAGRARSVGVRMAPARAAAPTARAPRVTAAKTMLDVARGPAGRTRMDIGSAPAGRTRMDVAAASAGRTRVDVAALTGRTRAEGAAMGGRTRAEGPSAGEFQQRARALQVAHFQKSAADAERAKQREARSAERARQQEARSAERARQQSARAADRARRAEESANAKHYRAIFASAQRNAKAIERVNAQSAARTARQQAAVRRSIADARQTNRQVRTEMLGTLGSVGLGIAGAVAGVAAAFAGVGFSAARAVIEVAAFRESSLVALEAVLGSSNAAGRSFRNAITIANQTPLDTQDVIQQTQSFAVAGFSEREITPLLAASSDLGAAFGQRSSEGFALALSQIRSAGRLQGQELLQLSNANVSRSAVLDSIARQMNLRGATPEARRRAAQTAVTRRRVTNQVGEQAALDAVRGRLDQGGQLGSFARRQSETLTGAISNARNAVFNLLVGIDFGNIPGIIAFKNILLQITAALTSGSPAANALRQGVMGAANAVGGFLARVVNPTTIAQGMAMVGRGFAVVQRFATAASPIVQSFVRGLGPGFLAGIAPLRALFAQLLAGGGPSAATLALIARAAGGLGTAFGFVAGAAVTMVGAVGSFFGAITAIGATVAGLVTTVLFPISQAFMSVGGAIVSGIIRGITGGIGTMGSAITSLGASAIASARAALGIHSPSRVFADLVGAQIPAGIAMGVHANAAMANDAVAGIVSPTVPQLGAGGGMSVNLTIEVNGASQPQETARSIRTEVEDALGSIFGQWQEQHA